MKFLTIFLMVLFISGCSTMLPGKIIALEDGSILPMQIQTSYGTGEMTAINPKTGENFKGTYTAVSSSAFSSTNGMMGKMPYNDSTVTTSNKASSKAVLIGDKGTVLNIYMDIQAGWRPIGFGDAEDNKGKKYSVQF